MLNRTPSDGELEFHVRTMRGADGKTDELEKIVKARDFLPVPEFVAKLDTATAALMYQALLLREAHPAEVSDVRDTLAEGRKTLAQVIAEITGTEEFRNLYR